MDVHQLIVPECAGCNKIDGDICISYLNPSTRHKLCTCPLKSTGVIVIEGKGGKKLNPIKASKRKMRR